MYKILLTEQPEIVQPAPVYGIPPEIQGVLRNGSYAIIVFFFIIFWITRKSIGDFTKEHLSMMKSLTDSNKQHSENSEKMVKSVERSTRTNIVLTKILAKYLNIDLDALNRED
ncbi:MAG: hypothetical protein KME59_21570 [Trichormus sp. ATA11-4-KO1]|jgi:hypothetical protein|nr:hypothetical protein [Trichormus sp. ATA11-4-KO1]